jgi:hypothetical protein
MTEGWTQTNAETRWSFREVSPANYKHTDIVLARDRQIPAWRGKNDVSDRDLPIAFEQGIK